MSTPFEGKTILLGVTGSIAAYKAADIASKLTQMGALVDVVLTQSALEFMTPLTFQSVTGRKAYVDADLWGGIGHVTHIGLGRAADLVVIAPCSANTMAKLARGIADNLLTVAILASHCPVLIAPAMDAGMYSHPATQENVEILRQRGVRFVGPAEGHLASGLVGVGRMTEPAEILGHIRYILAQGGKLTGQKVVVTAGGTQEPIDPVRAIINHSSGKQGYALAQAALDAGATVTLIHGPTTLSMPVGAKEIGVQTAAQMFAATLAESADADALLMAAAVADFRPAEMAANKIKKEGGVPGLRLEPTEDILAAVAERKTQSGFPRVTVGFAAESQALIESAQAKLKHKRLDWIVANDITAPDAGFAVDTNRVILLAADGSQESLPLMSKTDVAEAIVTRVAERLADLRKRV
jgi:phosphopantothenoylcysteine decarboxylase/phosphopantothenate--cysteine ligase